MEYRKKGITNDFKNYQHKYYDESGILNHDLYFEHENKIYAKVSGGSFSFFGSTFQVNPNNYVAHVNGADMVTNLGESGTTPIGGGPYTVVAAKVKTTGVVNQYYDQVAINVSVASGNLRLCAYIDNAGSPDARYVTDTGSFAAAAGYAWNSLTEFSLTTAANWLAVSQSAASVTYGYENQASGNTKYLAGTFGQLADPIAAGLTNSTTVIQMKLGHS